MLRGSRGFNIQFTCLPSSPAPLPLSPSCRPSPRLVPSSYRFPSGQKNSVINPPLRLISKDQHWPRSHLAPHHQNSVCRRCWEENLTETGFRMSGRLLSTCQAPIFQKEVFMWMTRWLEDVFIKQHTGGRWVDPVVTLSIAEQKGLCWISGSLCSHPKEGAHRGCKSPEGANIQCWGHAVRRKYMKRMDSAWDGKFCTQSWTEGTARAGWEKGSPPQGWCEGGTRWKEFFTWKAFA